MPGHSLASRAQDALWTPLSQNADWNTASNWTPARVPTVIASFPPRAGVYNVTIAQNTTIGLLDFDGRVEKYDFTLTGSAILSIEAGILNPSPDRPIFVANSDQEQFQFDGSTAGRANFINSLGGATVFNSGSTAGRAIITNNLGGATVFNNGSTALPMTAGFAGIPGSWATFSGPSESHDSAVVSAGVSVQLTPAISTYLNYDGQLGRDNYDSNAVTGGVRFSF